MTPGMPQGRLSLADLVEQRRREESRHRRGDRHRHNWLNGSRFARWHVPEAVEHEADNWLVTYLDMLTLLLAMLVVMLGVSHVVPRTGSAGSGPGMELVGSVDHGGLPSYTGPAGNLLDLPTVPPEWSQLALPGELPPQHPADIGPLPRNQAPEPEATQAEMAAAAEAAGLTPGTAVSARARTPIPPGALPPSPPVVPPTMDELGLKDLAKSVEVVINEQSVSFRISNELLFPSAQATLNPEGLNVLKRLATVINRSKYPLSVEGHSDNMPILTNQFPSNWELSTSRATSVLRELEHDGVDPTRMRAIGYSDTRPIQPNDTAAGRNANRRVELILEIRPRPPVTAAAASAAKSD
jgi:chemotaxis protein MotB